MKVNKTVKELQDRVLQISKEQGLSHIGSSLTAVEVMYEIYLKMNENDKFVLSAGHAGLAQMVMHEAVYGFDAVKLHKKHGTHIGRDEEYKFWCSTGSLGLGILIATGMAIGNPKANVYCLISDGEQFSGACLEGLRFIARNHVKNCKVYLNTNGWTAYEKVDAMKLSSELWAMLPDLEIRYTNSDFGGVTGLAAHYHVIK